MLVLTVPLMAEEQKIDPESVQIIAEDADSPYQVIGVVKASTDCKDTMDVALSYVRVVTDFRKEAAKAGADAIIFHKILSGLADPAKSLFENAEAGRGSVTATCWGVAVKMLDSAGAIAWENSHPKKSYDKGAPVEVTNGDIDRCYKVKGLVFAYASNPSSSEMDDSLRRDAKSDHAHAVIFTEHRKHKGVYEAYGVAVRYVK
jgi:hypothetical protein